MYGTASRNGLGMYGAARAQGLGMYGGDARAGLAGIITDWSQVSDAGLEHAKTFLPAAQLQQVLAIASAPRYTGPDTIAQRDNLLQGQQPGGQLWSLVHDAIGVVTPKSGGISFADAIVQYPQLTGLLVAFDLSGITSGAPADIQAEYSTPDALMTLATTRASQQGRFQTSVALPDSISAAAAAPYLQYVAKYLNEHFAETPTAIAGERDALVYMVLSYARQAAMSHGTTTLDVVGASGDRIVVATELIHAIVRLPDGTVYVVMDDVTGDPANRYVYQDVSKVKPQAFGPNGGAYERNGVTTCVDIVKGTGPWYTARVFGLVAPGSSCDATPDDFTGPWDLIPKDVTDALTYQSGAPVRVVPPAQQVTNIPTVSTVPATTPPPVLYQSPTAPPPAPATAPGGSGGSAPATTPPLYQPPVTVPASSGPTMQTTAPNATPPLYQSPMSNGPAPAQQSPDSNGIPQPQPSSNGWGLLLLVLGGIGYAVSRKKSRGTQSWG